MIKNKSYDLSFFIASQATYYPTFARIYIPKHVIKRDEPKSLSSKPKDLIVKEIDADDETPLERSIRRSRKNIKDIILCNQFEHFITLTIAKDRDDILKSKSKIKNWLKNEYRRKGKFQHIIVPELHKDQNALHFHGLIRGYKGEVKQSYYPDGNPVKENGRNIYHFPSYSSGIQNVQLIDNSIESIFKVNYYLQKYITKDMPRISGKKRYWASNSLKRPVLVDNPEPWHELVTADREYENEFGVTREYDLGKNALVDMFIEANQR